MRKTSARLFAFGLALTISSHLLAADPAATPPPAGDPIRERFDIEAQSVSTALRAYAQQTGEQVVFYSEVGKGRESTRVWGEYTRDQALQQLLQDTGLTYQRLNPRTVAISTIDATGAAQHQTAAEAAPLIRLAQNDATPAQYTGLRQAEVPSGGAAAAEGEPEGSDELFAMGEVVVTGTASRERTKFDSSVGISTFDSEDIAQQAPSSTADLISAVPGFWVESTSGSTQGNVFARGIIQDGGYRYVALMEDGIPVYPVFELSFYNPDQFIRVDEMVSRVEAVRGGTAPIFTSGAVGGAINFVTREAGEAPDGGVKVTFGDYGLYRGDLAWSGPINEQWGIAVGGYYRQSDGVRDPGYTADEGGQLRAKVTGLLPIGQLDLFVKYIDDTSLFVVPIPLRGSPDDPDSLDADPGDYSLHSEDLVAAGLPASAAEVGLQGSSLEDGIHPELFTAGASLRWDISDAIILSDIVRFTDGEVRFDGIFPGEAAVTGTDFAAARGVAPVYTVLNSGAVYDPTQFVQNHGHWVVNKEYEAIQNDLRLNFSAGPHDLAFGFYFADYSMSDRWSLGNLLLMDVSDQPNRLSLAGVTDPLGFTQYSFFNLAADYDAQAWALYASDEWQLTEALRLDFGVRQDNVEIDASVSNGATVNLDGNPATPWDNATALAGAARTDSSPDFDHVSWSVGFNFEFIDNHAVFGHYTEAAKLPHFDDVRGGSLLDDEVTNIEVGYKTSLEQIALFATFFQTEFDNVFFNDILADGTTARRFAATETRGVELEGVWNPIDVLTISFSITQQQPEYRDYVVRNEQTGTVTDLSDNQIRRIPETMARITPTFFFAGGRGRAYATYSHFGDRFSNDENTIELPKYDKIDAGVIFDVTDALTVQLSGDNLTDEVGLTEGNPRTDVGAGGIGVVYNARPLFGRSFQASGTYRF
jgi:iron complex outermembrane receptor protein